MVPVSIALMPWRAADFSGYVVGDAFVGGLAHESQGLANSRFRNDVQVRRLLQLHGQRLFERAVEDRVAGGIDEVGEQDAVFLGELGRLPGAEE